MSKALATYSELEARLQNGIGEYNRLVVERAKEQALKMGLVFDKACLKLNDTIFRTLSSSNNCEQLLEYYCFVVGLREDNSPNSNRLYADLAFETGSIGGEGLYVITYNLAVVRLLDDIANGEGPLILAEQSCAERLVLRLNSLNGTHLRPVT